MLPILISTAAAAAIAAGFWDSGGRSLQDQQFWPGCCANVDKLTSATPTVLISSGEPLNYNFAGFRGWSIGFALESTGCKGKGDGRGFRGE